MKRLTTSKRRLRELHLTIREFAAKYKVTEQTVRNWNGQGMPVEDMGDVVAPHYIIPVKRAHAWLLRMHDRGVIRKGRKV